MLEIWGGQESKFPVGLISFREHPSVDLSSMIMAMSLMGGYY